MVSLEGLRYLNFMKPGGEVVVNDHRINPPAVNLGEMEYPREVERTIRDEFNNFYSVWRAG